MKRSGFTLIELMIALAMIGVVTGLSSTGILENRRLAATLVQRERALQLLEAEADAMIHGAALPAATRERLLLDLPHGRLESRRDGEITVLRATWTLRGKPQSLELAVAGRAR